MKKVFIIILIFISYISFAQKGQRIAYVDMNYILENVPEYVEAQSKLTAKVNGWQQKLDVLTDEVETLRADLSNEKTLLTKELIAEREEDIIIKDKELKRLQIAYFGPTGDLFQLRKQLAKPVQDQVYNAIQEISKMKRYDIVFDKSSDLIMLYTNSKFDISELVLNKIVKGRKRKVLDEKKNRRKTRNTANNSKNTKEENDDSDNEETEITDDVTESNIKEKTKAEIKNEERIAKREALKAKIKAQQEARIRKRDSLKKVADDKRAARLKVIEDRKQEREEKIKSNN